MNFNELMQRMRDLDTTAPVAEVSEEVVDECGMMGGMGMPSMPPKQQDSVTMNVSMNGSGAGGIRDLMAILKNIDDADGDIGPMDRDDMPEPERFGDTDMDDIAKKEPVMGMMAMDDDFENEPDEIYQDVDAVTGKGDDLHSQGSEAPKVNGGGNPMQVRTGETFKLPAGDLKIRLEGLYNEIKHRK
jgi:hypothetical protein